MYVVREREREGLSNSFSFLLAVSLDQGEQSMLVEKAPLPRLLQEVGENSALVDNLTASSRPKGIFPQLDFSSFQVQGMLLALFFLISS